jgi:hypothetical protein
MSANRALVLTLAAFAVSLAALSVGGGTAWVRCGRDSTCSGDLALGVAAAAPAALLASVVTLLLRRRASSVLASRLLLACAVGLAAVPLGVFVIRDLVTLAVMAVLLAALVYLALIEDGAADADVAGGEGAVDAPGTSEAVGGGDTAAEARTRAAAHVLSDRAEQTRDAEPFRASLCVLGLRDFEQLVAIYEALSAHPYVTSVIVRRFVRAFAVLEISAADAASWTSIENLLSSIADITSAEGSSGPLSTDITSSLSLPGDGRPDDSPGDDGPVQLLRWRSPR